ncbi:hypothetical protein [Streptomyces sp. NPDC001415]
MDIEQARTRIAAIRAAGDTVCDIGELDRLWAVLETVGAWALST